MAVTITDASLQGIYNRLHAIPEYHPLDAQTFADWSVEAGDVVTVSRENDSYSSPVHTSRMVWKGSPETQLTSGGNKQRDPVSTVSQKKYRRGSAAQRSQEIIQSTLEDEVDGVRSTVTQMANQWSVVVEGTGDNAHIKPAVIQASIDAATSQSKIHLGADKIELDGSTFAEYFASGNITLAQYVTLDDGTEVFLRDNSAIVVSGEEVDIVYGGNHRPIEYCLANAEVSNDKVHFTHMNGDELQIYINNDGELVFKDAQGNEFSFEKAVYPGTITGIACPNGAVTDGQTRTNGTVEASGTDITNDPYSVDFSMNYESFRPQGTSIDTAAVYFMLDGVKIGRYSDGNLLASNIKKNVSIMGITGSYEGSGGSGTITEISCPDGAVTTGQERTQGKVRSLGTNITNSPYEVNFAIGYEAFTPSGSSANTAAIYFELDGVKIGRKADSNLVAGNIKGGVTIFGITGTYSSHATIDRIYSEPGTLASDTTVRTSTTIRAEGTNVATKEATYSLSYFAKNDDLYTNLNGYEKVQQGTQYITQSSIVARVKAPIDIYALAYQSDSEPSGTAWHSLPNNAGVNNPLVIGKKEAWYKFTIDVGPNHEVRKWYKVPIEISGKGDCVSENIKKGKSICGVNGSLDVTQTAPWANQIGSNAERKSITMEADAKQSTFKLVKNTVTYQGASIPCVELRDSSNRAVGRFYW